MAKKPYTALFGLVLGLVVGMVGLVLLVRGGGARADPEPIEVEARTLPGPNGRLDWTELVPPPRVVSTGGSEWNEPTTVLWPCRVELDLVQASYLPTEDSVPPIGTGRTARLSGRIGDATDQGVRAEVNFLAGPNAGRTLLCDATGSFGATNLYPGLAVVKITGPRIALPVPVLPASRTPSRAKTGTVPLNAMTLQGPSHLPGLTPVPPRMFCDAPEEKSTPSRPLHTTRLLAIVLCDASVERTTPQRALPSGCVPLASLPMKLPWTVLCWACPLIHTPVL